MSSNERPPAVKERPDCRKQQLRCNSSSAAKRSDRKGNAPSTLTRRLRVVNAAFAQGLHPKGVVALQAKWRQQALLATGAAIQPTGKDSNYPVFSATLGQCARPRCARKLLVLVRGVVLEVRSATLGQEVARCSARRSAGGALGHVGPGSCSF